MMITEVEAEEVSGGCFIGIFTGIVGFCFGVKDGGFVIVAIGSKEMPVFELFDFGEGVACVIDKVSTHELIHAG